MTEQSKSYIAMRAVEGCMALSGAMLLKKNVFPKCDLIEKGVFLVGAFGVACMAGTKFEDWWDENCEKFGFEQPMD